jgi:hypothetical protein
MVAAISISFAVNVGANEEAVRKEIPPRQKLRIHRIPRETNSESESVSVKTNGISIAPLLPIPPLPGAHTYYTNTISLHHTNAQSHQRLLEWQKQRLADHQTNALLWANLRGASLSKDQEKIAKAERELSEYLTRRLSQIQGTNYPAGMSLRAIMQEYKKTSQPTPDR